MSLNMSFDFCISLQEVKKMARVLMLWKMVCCVGSSLWALCGLLLSHISALSLRTAVRTAMSQS